MSEASNGEPLDEIEEPHRPLVERLQRLRWPEPPAGVRERGLEELRRTLAELQEGQGDPDENGNGNGANPPPA